MGYLSYSAEVFEHLFQNIGNVSQDQKKSLAASQTIAQSPWLWHEIPADNQINLDRSFGDWLNFDGSSSLLGLDTMSF